MAPATFMEYVLILLDGQHEKTQVENIREYLSKVWKRKSKLKCELELPYLEEADWII